MKTIGPNTWTNNHATRQLVKGHGRRKVWAISTADAVRKSDGLVLESGNQYGFVQHTHKPRSLVLHLGGGTWCDVSSYLTSRVVDLVVVEPPETESH